MFDHFRGMIRDFRHTGALLPSSAAFAREMTSALRGPREAKRILEVGPGAGPMTRQILRRVQEGDVFDLVEINEVYANHIEDHLLVPARQRHPGVTMRMYVGPVESVDLEGRYDAIISALPMNNFEIDLVHTIMNRFLELLAPGGELTFFEYAGIRKVGRLVGSRERREHLAGITRFYSDFDRRPGVRKALFLRNLPPTTRRIYTAAEA